ncbi:MAG: tagatose-6-phosphate ketose isomerase, partial [Mycoplasma sp.]|nr:tagatose-6-phosphate ketose isomerase [Mycoplasma sp.]
MSINEFFKKNNLNYQTQKEINNQFSLWPILVKKIEKQYKKQIDKLKLLDNNYKFIISGAGTSEFVGNIAKSLFNIKNIDSIATTDLIT